MPCSRLKLAITAFALSLPLMAQFGPPPSTGGGSQARQVPLSGATQTGSVTTNQTPSGGGAASVNTLNGSVSVQGTYSGSLPTGTATKEPMTLSLQEAVRRGLEYNLGMVSGSQSVRQARAERLSARAATLPDVNGSFLASNQEISLVESGFTKFKFPGFAIPTVLGPFSYFDLRASLSESVLNFTNLHNLRASRETERSTELALKDSREFVVLGVSGQYLQVIAAAARVESARAQVQTSQALYQQALDRNKSGLNARIDVNRSQVELQTQQQRLTSLETDFAKQKLTLARLIGLPLGQPINLTDQAPYHAAAELAVDDALTRAYQKRMDLQAAQSQVRAAEEVERAARAEFRPSVTFNANYGIVGTGPTRSTYTVSGGVNMPIWRSGRIEADVQQAQAAVAQRKAEYEDLRGQVEYQIRNAFLDIEAAANQVRVAESNRALAGDTLSQARDRFAAGVADTIEVVQAQESVASAEQDYISSLFVHNLAKVSLARSMGEAEQNVGTILQGK